MRFFPVGRFIYGRIAKNKIKIALLWKAIFLIDFSLCFFPLVNYRHVAIVRNASVV